jgi:hemerythrin
VILTSELICGYRDIDAQHRAILDRLEATRLAAGADDLAGTKQALVVLGDALMGHFQAEEALMSESAYPERGRHKVAHDIFLQDFHLLTREIEAMGICPPTLSWLSTRLPEWLKFHIQVNDLPLARFLSARQNQGAAASSEKKPRPS